jgi:hypothetical protein
MDNINFDETLKNLNNKVINISDQTTGCFNTKQISSFNLYYSLIPICICALLVFLKPTFILEDAIGGEKKNKIEYSKLFCVTLIFTAVIVALYLIYNYNKTK